MTETYSEEDGVKYDEHIHQPILDSMTPENREKHLRRARRRAKERHKMTDAEIEALYGKEPAR